MVLAVIFFCIICCLNASRFDKLWNPQTLFCGFIGFIFLLSLYEYKNQCSLLTTIITIVGVIFFSVGVNLASSYNSSFEKRHALKLNNNFVFVVVACLTAWTSYRAFTTVIPLLISGYSLDYVRMVYFGQEVDGVSKGALDGIIEVFINQPFLYAIMSICACELSREKKQRQLKPITNLLIIIWIILSCLTTGGRVLVYCFVVVLLYAFLISREYHFNIKVSKSITKKVGRIILISFLIYVIYTFSVIRNDETEFELIHGISAYFSGCVPHTSMRLQGTDIDYTYGATFVSGLIRPLMLVYKYTLGNGLFPEFYQKTIDIAFVLQERVIINGKIYNAFTLPFYYFYIDGNIIGVIFESLIYGFFCGRAYFRLRCNPSHINICKYLVILIFIFTSMIRFSPYIVSMMYAYIFVQFCYKKVC